MNVSIYFSICNGIWEKIYKNPHHHWFIDICINIRCNFRKNSYIFCFSIPFLGINNNFSQFTNINIVEIQFLVPFIHSRQSQKLWNKVRHLLSFLKNDIEDIFAFWKGGNIVFSIFWLSHYNRNRCT